MKFVNYILILLTVILSACLRDNTESCPEGNGKIILQLSMPEMTATRAEIYNWAVREYDIAMEDMYVLVFNDKGGDGSNDMFMYYTQPEQEIPLPENPTTRRYSITLQKSENSTEKQRLVFIANCTDEIEALLADPALTTKTKQELFAGLQFGAKKWGTMFPIPMWGESQRSVIVTYSTKGGDFGNVDMLFAVARVDVAVNAYDDYTQAAGLNSFILQTAELRNVRSKGYVVPQAAAQFDGSVVKYPSVVPAAEGNQINAVGSFAIGNSVSPYTLSMSGLLFMNEADNRNSTNDKRAFLLIGGWYTAPGESRNTSEMSYYRIDFYDRGNPGETAVKYLDVLRGHRYMVNITGADGPGYPTPEEAISSVTTKMNAEVLVWNTEGILTDLTGEYTLRVDPPELKFNGLARGNSDTNNKVDVFTDWGRGWKVTKITDVTSGTEVGNTWLSVDKTEGDPYVTTVMSVNVTTYNSAVPRYGRIYIEAGKWTYILNVMQKLGGIDVYPKAVSLNFDYRQVPLADNTLNVETDFGWKLSRIEYAQGASGWLSVIDPQLADPLNIFDAAYDLTPGNMRMSEKASLRVAVNTGLKARTATVYFATEDGVEASVEVTQSWTDCGAGGVAKYKMLGGTNVKTHIYGGNMREVGESLLKLGYFRRVIETGDWVNRGVGDGTIRTEQAVKTYLTGIPYKYGYSCFMVENSKAGNWDYATNLDGKAGPFYLESNAASACPAGWRLITKADADNIHIPTDVDYQLWLGYYTPGYSNYWGPSIYANHMEYVNGNPVAGNGRSLIMWGDRSAGATLITVRNNWSPSGVAVDYDGRTDAYFNYIMPVRCVEDVDPYDYPERFDSGER